MNASTIVQRMLENDEVSDFLDRNDDLGWDYWLGFSHGIGWGRVEGIGPYKSLDEACAAAKEAKLFDTYRYLRVSRVPRHTPDLTDRRKKINYLKQLRGWNLDYSYRPTPDAVSQIYDRPDDSPDRILDRTVPPNEPPVGESIVAALLEGDDIPDPKSYAMKHVKLPDLGTRGWIHCDGSETPVQKYLPGEDKHWHPDGGWELSDANYAMADRGDRIYNRWYREVIQALNSGKDKGVAAGFKWKYVRDPEREAQEARWKEQERTGNYDPIPELGENLEPDEAKDIVDQLLRDGEYLGVYVTREDRSFKFLTDRFGDYEDNDPDLTPEDLQAIQRLSPLLGHSEQLWIAKRDGVYGIYSELEFHDLDRPDDQLGDDRESANQSWERSHGKVPANSEEAAHMLTQMAKQIGEKVRGSVVYIYVGPDSMLGVEIRIFIPNPTPEQVKALEAAI